MEFHTEARFHRFILDIDNIYARKDSELLQGQNLTPMDIFGVGLCENFERCYFVEELMDIAECLRYRDKKAYLFQDAQARSVYEGNDFI